MSIIHQQCEIMAIYERQSITLKLLRHKEHFTLLLEQKRLTHIS